MNEEADICIIGEGSYPYNVGGVAEWIHKLILEHHERTFHILSLVAPNPDLTFRYKFPANVVGHTTYIVQNIPPGAPPSKAPPETWNIVKSTLKGLVSSKSFDNFGPLLTFFREHQEVLGKQIFSESMESWNMLLELYNELIPSGPFKSYFGTILTLAQSLFSIILPELPKARLYHSVCTGYAGFILYRAKFEKNAPCIVTEHGIYTNERRIEIAMADWIVEMDSLNLALEDKKKTLKDFWLNAFFSFAHACYSSCEEIISTFDGNQGVQIESGADPKKVHTIVHGASVKEYTSMERFPDIHCPTVAFIGRVVPIKDVKTFIRACFMVKQEIFDACFYALGPTEEDPLYFEECQKLVETLGLSDCFTFFGKVDLKKYVSKIDLVVFTSISEAQPLVILELGAVGIPFVATNTGACDQLLNGSSDEFPRLGQGGIITPLVNPEATARGIIRLLQDKVFYQKCSEVMVKRIRTYYSFEKQHMQYREIYAKYIRS